ncbi:TetR/AcrR family transcriptional regulator [Bacillus sp. ISL-41]|uniref:TetR/AcrR family transcriptional regulator n=1 Tax=Bacillus sp. ISL-41 TaxID=2819127 RepID=UPI001BE96174|nr:TetR/AcrR family transcriptional regulator [Bacillus sp. ISL-41]MBT2642839.1 TetR/AcrR family transcriptional regulator [Bacillus sp. ISL-41]
MSVKSDYIDRRILKSKRALKEALISLMKMKEFKEITVKDLVQGADLNRGTFYKHYQYKEDLLNEIIDDVITDLIESYREPYINKENFEVDKLTTSAIKVFDHVSQYSDFYSLIVQSTTLTGFQHKMTKVLKELTLKDLSDQIKNEKINKELHASYQAFAIAGLIIEWIEGGYKYSSHYMAEQLLEIIKYNSSNAVFRPNG